MKYNNTFLAIALLSSFNVHAICEPSIDAVAPNSRYADIGNGLISDVQTGLMWKKCSEGQSNNDCSTGSATTYTWQQALQLVDTLNTSGGFAMFTDWRLPNINELASLIEEQCQPSINEAVFQNFPLVSRYYWSSTPDLLFNPETSHVVDFAWGAVSLRNRQFTPAYVRLVRDGV